MTDRLRPSTDAPDSRLSALYRADMEDTSTRGTHPSEDDWVALATGTAEPATRDRMVDHLVACAECAAVFRGLSELRRESTAIDPGVTPAHASPWWMSHQWLAVAAVALLVFGASTIARRLSPAPASSPMASTVPPAAVAAPADVPPSAGTPARPSWAADLVAPEIQVPPMLALTMRGATGDDRDFVARLGDAFDRYRRGDYDTAASALATLSDTRQDVPEIAFYAGVAHLLAGHAGDAVPLLTRAIASDARGDDARWFAAVARARTGDHAGADDMLRDLCGRAGARRADACAALGTHPAER